MFVSEVQCLVAFSKRVCMLWYSSHRVSFEQADVTSCSSRRPANVTEHFLHSASRDIVRESERSVAAFMGLNLYENFIEIVLFFFKKVILIAK